ncbi:MAG: STAS domain-containing protein [Roseiflexaceae bacterium]
MAQNFPPADYLAFLEQRRSALIDAIAADCIAELEVYAGLPPNAVRQSLDRTFGTLLEAFMHQDMAVLKHWVEQTLAVRFDQGLTLEQSVRLPMIFRRRIVGISLEAVSQAIPGAAEGTAFMNNACDGIIIMLTDFYQTRIEAATAQIQRFKVMAESVIDGISMADSSFQLTYANPAFRALTGYDDQITTMPVRDLLDPATLPILIDTILPAIKSDGVWRGTVNYRHADGTIFPVQISLVALRNSEGAFDGTVVVARDMREEQALEIERERLQDEMFRMQELALRELSTPLLAVSDHAVVMPLVGAIDSRRAQQVIETLLEGITTHHANIAILDITGVTVVDTQVANALLRAAQAVRLLGARVVLTGIRPEIAQTLVGLGADLSEVVTRSSLQSGIAYAIRQQ